LGWLGLSLAGAGACGGVVETDSGGSSAGSSGASTQFACPVCSNAKLSCVVNGSMDTLVRDATSKTGCAFAFSESSFSVDCDSQTFCIEGLGCSNYTASGSAFTVRSSFGDVKCAPAQ
jgi:hypothetical protein